MTKAMKVLVCGGRDYKDETFVWRYLDTVVLQFSAFRISIIEGGASGADRFAANWADARGIPRERFDADWAKHKKSAGPIRNQRMMDEGKPDIVIAFPGDKGTADMKARARKEGLTVVEPKPEPCE